jgi:methylmalonyl-CoA/ethylmalonyl-CoA epimerase
MRDYSSRTPFGPTLEQMAWVIKDISKAEEFFNNTMGVPQFVKMENVRAEDTDGTYLGKPGDFCFHLYLAYSGNAMVELIQPVSGNSIYRDFLEKRPEGGVQHIAFTLPEAELDMASSELTAKGYPVVQSLTLPVARVAYFDTCKEIGVYTELIGLTEAGFAFIRQLKGEVVESI